MLYIFSQTVLISKFREVQSDIYQKIQKIYRSYEFSLKNNSESDKSDLHDHITYKPENKLFLFITMTHKLVHM